MMAESNSEFLARLERDSRTQQQTFIQNIASRLGRLNEGGIPEHPSKGAPDFWTSYELDYEERITRFMDNWRAGGGFTERIATYEELPEVIARTIHELGAKSLMRQNQPELVQLELERVLPELQHIVWNAAEPQQALHAASKADAGIAVADYAVAYTGSVVVTSSEDKGRSVTLLPNILITIVPAERLKTRLGEVMHPVSEIPAAQFPAGVHFISGPSRSSDIENDLTIGVHGPGVAFALIVG